MSPLSAVTERPRLTVREAVALLRVSRTTIYDAVADGRIPAIRYGRAIRLDADVVAAILDAGLPAYTAA